MLSVSVLQILELVSGKFSQRTSEVCRGEQSGRVIISHYLLQTSAVLVPGHCPGHCRAVTGRRWSCCLVTGQNTIQWDILQQERVWKPFINHLIVTCTYVHVKLPESDTDTLYISTNIFDLRVTTPGSGSYLGAHLGGHLRIKFILSHWQMSLTSGHQSCSARCDM